MKEFFCKDEKVLKNDFLFADTILYPKQTILLHLDQRKGEQRKGLNADLYLLQQKSLQFEIKDKFKFSTKRFHAVMNISTTELLNVLFKTNELLHPSLSKGKIVRHILSRGWIRKAV